MILISISAPTYFIVAILLATYTYQEILQPSGNPWFVFILMHNSGKISIS